MVPTYKYVINKAFNSLFGPWYVQGIVLQTYKGYEGMKDVAPAVMTYFIPHRYKIEIKANSEQIATDFRILKLPI